MHTVNVLSLMALSDEHLDRLRAVSPRLSVQQTRGKEGIRSLLKEAEVMYTWDIDSDLVGAQRGRALGGDLGSPGLRQHRPTGAVLRDAGPGHQTFLYLVKHGQVQRRGDRRSPHSS